jgi:pimeloyl-ACP methyl ester carboxylesterase
LTQPTLILVPCLSGAPWRAEQLTALQDLPLVTFRLDDAHRDIEGHVDDLLTLAEPYRPYVLVGDSFGAQVALAAATRQPPGLVGLVMSGGFAATPIDDLATKLKVWAAGFLPGALYRNLVLPLHADLLKSRFDDAGDRGWSRDRTLELFRDETTWQGYVRRTRAAMSADYRRALGEVQVPTLILTPEDDTLIGPDAARVMRDGIAGAQEVIIETSGHMFRFSHPRAFAQAIRDFLEHRSLLDARRVAA